MRILPRMTRKQRSILFVGIVLCLLLTKKLVRAQATLVWTEELENAPWLNRFGHKGINFGSDLFVFGGRVGKCVLNDVWTATEIDQWTEVENDELWSKRFDFEAVASSSAGK
eukprot:TRINITY_DN3936_c0_g1_i2.p1 TRINITY_DN3936_c0_g1~~TRINITY_DN3936_c0_g1_i2.p1  ORF type:complete len:112 (+),score=26.64 TRINITY_DN3936_c0_g1_i2:106-441(+)